MSKRILALLLAVTMVVSMAAFPVSATETTEEPVEEIIVPEQEAEVEATDASEGEDTTTESVPAEEAHTNHCMCAGISINSKANHSCVDVTWTEFPKAEVEAATGNYTLAAGNYYLADNVTYTGAGDASTNITIAAGTTVRICLNGYKFESYGRFFVRGTMEVTDCSYDSADGSFDGSMVTNATGKDGAIATSFGGARINIYGGNFTSNVVAGSGGLFYVSNQGVLTSETIMNIYNGKFHDGQAKTAGSIYVSLANGSTIPSVLNIYGGEIVDGATVATSGTTNAGNIYCAGTINMYGGTVSGGSGYNVYGGNILVTGTLNIEDGTISNGIASKAGGNILIQANGKCYVKGGQIYGGGGYDLSAGGNIKLHGSTGNPTLEITGGKIWNGMSDVDGYNAGSHSTSSTGSNIYVQTGTLKIDGGSIGIDAEGNAQTGGIAGGGGNIYVAAGTVTISNGTIANGTAYKFGGNIQVAGGTVTITGGTFSNGEARGISETDANDGMGGNLYTTKALSISNATFNGGVAQDRGGSIASNGGKLTMNNVTVDGGEAAKSGGAIFITGSGAAGSTFTNCTVKNGSAGEGGNGGNLCVNPGASATITGGTYEAGSALNGGNICAFAACTIDGATIKDGQASGGAELTSFNGGYYNLIGDTHIINSSGYLAVLNSTTSNVTHTISGGTYEGAFAIDDVPVVIEGSPVIDSLRMTKNAYKTPVDMTGYVNPAAHTIDLTLSGTALPTVFAYVDEDLSTIFNYADGSVVYTAGAGTGEDVDTSVDSGEGESGTGDVDSVGTLHVVKTVAEPETFQVTVPAGKTLYYEFATTNPALKITVSDNVTSETVDGVTVITNEGAEDVTATVTVEDLTGTAEYPINVVFEWNAAETEATATVTVPAGTTYYYESWNVTVENTLTANGVAVEFVPGSMMLRQPSTWSITNSSEEAVEYTLVVTYIEGSMNNPVDLTVGTAAVPGENTAAVAEGGQPIYYEWKAPAAGELTITMTGSNWTYVINNMSSYVYGDNHASNDKTVVSSETVLVKANQKIQVLIGTADYSKGDVTFTASFAGDSTSNPIMVDFVWNEEETEATATVKVPGKSTLYFGSWNITAENALTANDVAVEFVPGSMMMRQPSTWSISNTESAVAEYTLKVVFAEGSSRNPAELTVGTTAEPGANTAAVVGGGMPYIYEWTATADGKLTIAMTGSNWTYVINNMTSYAYGDNHASSDNEVVASEVVDVKAGDLIQIAIGTDDYAAASVAFTAAFEEAAAAEATITWYGRSVLLQDLLKIGMYFTASSEQNIEEVGALLWTGDDFAVETDFTVTSTTAKKYEDLQDIASGYGLYYVESDGILAQNLDTVLYMIPYVKTEAGYVYGEVMGGEEKGSILSYAADVYLRDAASADTKHLVIDLLNYATAARTYFGYTEGLEAPETPFNSILSAEDKVVEWTESLNKEYPADITEGATYDVTVYGKNVVIQQALSITYYYLGNTTAGVMYWTEEDFNAADVYDETTKSGDAVFARYQGVDAGTLNGIFAYNIYDNYYFRAYDENGDMSKIVGTSIAAYLTYLIEQNESSTEAENIALVELAKAMQVYGENARTNPDVNKG